MTLTQFISNTAMLCDFAGPTTPYSVPVPDDLCVSRPSEVSGWSHFEGPRAD